MPNDKIPQTTTENLDRCRAILQHYESKISYLEKMQTRAWEKLNAFVDKIPDQTQLSTAQQNVLERYEWDTEDYARQLRDTRAKMHWQKRQVRFLEEKLAREQGLTQRPFEVLKGGVTE